MWTLRYILINVTYFAVYSGLHAYAAVFLADKGFSSTWIGITLALANILSVILQPLIAGIIDKQGKLTNRNTAMIRRRYIKDIRFEDIDLMAGRYRPYGLKV